MTRIEMAAVMDRVIATYRTDATITKGLYPDEEAQATFAADELEPVVAELRKSCAGCRDYQQRGPGFLHSLCVYWETSVPIDGSGFCHNWTKKRGATNG